MYFWDIPLFTMSKELLEFSVLVDEKFDMSFNLASGLLGFVLRFFGR
jgi:hypothetical protein